MSRTPSIVVTLVSLVGALLVPAVLLAPAAPAAVTAAMPRTSSAARAAGYLDQARSATNAARTHRHRRPLGTNSCLDRAARLQAARMARRRTLFHSPDFRAIGPRCGLGAWGENVARAVGSDRGRGVVRQWMASSGHRANILDPRYRLLGMGAVHTRGAWWVVQVFGRRT